MRFLKRVLSVVASVSAVGLSALPVQAVTVSADYRGDFQTPAPSAGWAYQWNSGGAIGNSANYTNLIHSPADNRYDVDGVAGLPGADPGAFVFLGSTGGHPGRGSADANSGGISRFAIASYTVQANEAGRSYLALAAGKDATAGQNGLDVQVYVNNTLVTSRTNARQAAFTFDLGQLNAGDIVRAAVGPNTADGSDGFSLDANLVNLRGATVVADYTNDFQTPAPKAGWTYQWNSSGPIGNSANYSNLLSTGTVYDVDGVAGLPGPNPGAFVFLGANDGHPGRGSADGGSGGLDRYAIAGFTVNTSGTYDVLGAVSRRLGAGGGTSTLDVEVYVNNTLLLNLGTVTNEAFLASLGALNAGDRIYFAVGPDVGDGADGFQMDFTVFASIPEPATASLGLIALGGLMLRRRRLA